jgi:5'/3'-nucleotidase SurE
MRHSLNKAFPHAKVVTIAPHIDDRWGSLRVTDPYNGQSIEKIATDFYSIKNGSVADVIYHAIQSREDYVKSPWDLVVAGCTYGSTLGLDIYHSGNASACMLATSLLSITSLCISQEIDPPIESEVDVPPMSEEDLEPSFAPSYNTLPDILRKVETFEEGSCWNINIPRKPSMGVKSCQVSSSSIIRPVSQNVKQVQNNLGRDIQAVSEGYCTVSRIGYYF